MQLAIFGVYRGYGDLRRKRFATTRAFLLIVTEA